MKPWVANSMGPQGRRRWLSSLASSDFSDLADDFEKRNTVRLRNHISSDKPQGRRNEPAGAGWGFKQDSVALSATYRRRNLWLGRATNRRVSVQRSGHGCPA